MTTLQLPARYEPQSELGKGGGGEVWAVRDRHTGASYALKVLSADATESEMAALVREAVTLSGLEGLGVPRVLRFGRLPGTGRPFMVRELVEGSSLQDLVDERAAPKRCLEALAGAAEQVTLVHRAGLLHGDIKPANIIVAESGRATLVDLGLAAPWRDAGTTAKGLTPKFAAPELFLGKPLTVRAEVYALGVALADIVEAAKAQLDETTVSELLSVAGRATSEEPSDRYPSADEFSSAVRRAARLSDVSQHAASAVDIWPIVGIEATASRLFDQVVELSSGGALRLVGEKGSGQSVLLRRLAWSLGVEGRPLAWIDEAVAGNASAVKAELDALPAMSGVTLLVDEADRLDATSIARLVDARRDGARLVVAGDGPLAERAQRFEVPPLGVHAAMELVRRSVPSLTERIVRRVVTACSGRPGELRNFVRLMAERAVVSDDDVEQLLHGYDADPGSLLPEEPLARAIHLLDRGRYTDALAAIDLVKNADPLPLAVARARLHLGLGDATAALEQLDRVRLRAEERPESADAKLWTVYLARAHVGLGEYGRALELLDTVAGEPGPIGAEAIAYQGLALSYVGDNPKALEVLVRGVEQARNAGSARTEALALVCTGIVMQRADDTEGARRANEEAIVAAQRAGDASYLATSQLNLAGILKMTGDLAGAIEHYEAAVDMGRRSGRRSTVRNALLNLANLDLYLGRLARARASIETLEEQRAQLPRIAQAQLLGHKAELFVRSHDIAQAVASYEETAAAYQELGLALDAAEPRLEGVLIAARAERPDVTDLARKIARAEAELGDSQAHRSLLALAKASVAWVADDEVEARKQLEQGLVHARQAGQRDLVWRTLETRAEVVEASGQPVSARRDREEALAVLEEIAGRLPRDLREVFWNDPRRRRLRAAVEVTLGSALTEHALGFVSSVRDRSSMTSSSITSMTSTPLERRLARILEVNAELLGEVNLDRLTARVTDHAVDMLKAERGFVLLQAPDGTLTIHTSRTREGNVPHEEFSKSIADKVIQTGEPVVSLNARGDSRLQSYASVHQLMLESVACVPIFARSGPAIGALYVETRLRPGVTFERELPTLRAFADQVALAIETAALIRQNQERADALAVANRDLQAAQQELKELLGERTAKLKRARERLREARDTLYGHFGYQGLVGTSAAMRRVYALIDRVKSTDVPMLITGESGTGKELAARAIHMSSPRAPKPFLGVNCGAIPEHLLESELFGHVRGAFTGADRDRKGLFREAEGGSVLLDEIGEMPHRMQAGLLRVLQEMKVRPVGGSQEQSVDVRMIFATHRDLRSMVESGKFREDLYYRIVVVEMNLPPLRERTEDIPPLVDHFLGLFAARYKRDKLSVSRDAMRRLVAYEWPGNVRQLEHVLLNAWVLSDDPVLEAEDFDIPDGHVSGRHPAGGLPGIQVGGRHPPDGLSGGLPDIQPARRSPERNESEHMPEHRPEPPSRGAIAARRQHKETLSKHRRDEKDRILECLQACNWNRVKAAELSGIPRRTFYRRLREYGIQ